MKAIRRILASLRKADTMFNLIQDGDTIVVGVSGGKDSLLLVYALNLYTKFSQMNFKIVPVMLDLGFPNSDFTNIQKWFKDNGMELVIEPCQDVYSILKTYQDNHYEPKLPCSICSRMKKAAINKYCNEHGYNKAAFGHHADDAIETLLMNQIHGGRIATFAPKMVLERAQITFIRPLIFARETDIIQACKELNISPMKSPCPNDKITERETTKEMLIDIYKNHKESKDNYKYMLINGDQLDLWYDKIEYKLNNSNIYVKVVRTKKETLEMISIRYKTFTQQMNIQFDDEFDGSDNNAVNFLIYQDKTAVGTIRYVQEDKNVFRLGRFAVLPEYRKHGLGTQLFKFVENYIKLKVNPCTIYFHGMAYLKDYYIALGYECNGDIFLEQDIEHLEFRKFIK